VNLTCDDVADLAAGFVLGALAPDEEAAVRQHLAECPDAHAEIEQLGGVAPYLAETVEPVEPPAGLRARLLDAAAAERPARATAVAPAVPATATEMPVAAPAPVAAPGSPVAAAPPMRAPDPSASATIAFPGPAAQERRVASRTDRLGRWGLAIAAVLAIAVLGAWNLQLQARLSGVQADLAAAQAYQQGVAAVLDVGTGSGAQTAFLAAARPDLKSTGVAAAAADGTVVMALHDLAPTAGSQVYEAWLIVGSNAPVAIGGFTVRPDGTGVLRTSSALAKPGAVLALTLEPLPNPTAPAGPVVSAGSLVAPTS
jgi:hypothetical protein